MKIVDKVRLILNAAFIVFAVITLILYISGSEGEREYFYTGVIALSLKVFEFILRFVN
jgi:hypothetical protein